MRSPHAHIVLAILAIALPLVLPQSAVGGPVVASFTYSPPAPLTGETVSFTSASTGTITRQDWDLDADGDCDDASGPSVRRSFPIAGGYAVKLCVNGSGATQTQTVTVRNRTPVSSFVQSPASPVAGESVYLTSTSSDADGPIVSLAWDLQGDGRFDDGVGMSAVSRSFARPGTYRVGLRVLDRDAATSVSFRSIRVGRRAPTLLTLLSPFPIVRLVSSPTPTGARIALLAVSAPRGVDVTLRCRGRGCPYRRRTGVVGSRPFRFVRLQRALRAGVVIRVFVTKPDTVGKYTRFRIRRGRVPARVDQCVAPGSKRPIRCSLLSPPS